MQTQTQIAAAMTAAIGTAQHTTGPLSPQIDLVTGARRINFDPFVYIDEQMTEAELKCRILTSSVWGLDIEIVNAATSLYFEIRADYAVANPGVPITMDDLINAFIGTHSDERYWGEGRAFTLLKLLSMQDDLHMAATRAAHTTGWLSYQPKSIDELVLASKAMPIDSDTLANLRALAKMTADATKDLDERYRIKEEDALDMSVKGLAKRAADNAEFRRSLCPAIRVFVEEGRKLVDRRMLVRDVSEYTFADLGTPVKLSLLTKVRNANLRARGDLAPRVDNTTFNMCLAESAKAAQAFDKAIDVLVRDLEQERLN